MQGSQQRQALSTLSRLPAGTVPEGPAGGRPRFWLTAWLRTPLRAANGGLRYPPFDVGVLAAVAAATPNVATAAVVAHAREHEEEEEEEAAAAAAAATAEAAVSTVAMNPLFKSCLRAPNKTRVNHIELQAQIRQVRRPPSDVARETLGSNNISKAQLQTPPPGAAEYFE